MNKSENLYQQFIVNGIQTLPAEALLEVASFVYFIRQKVLTPPIVEEELYQGLIVWNKEAVSRNQPAISDAEIEAVCGLYQADCAVSLEQMEEAIMQGAVNGRY